MSNKTKSTSFGYRPRRPANDFLKFGGSVFVGRKQEASLHTQFQEISSEERNAPEGKCRVILRASRDKVYFIGDYDSADEAIKIAKIFWCRDMNGIVTTSDGLGLYPQDPHGGYMLMTRKELLELFGRKDGREYEPGGKFGKRPLSDRHVDGFERKQAERNIGWKPGHKMLVFWRDISKATGAGARWGDI